MILYQNRPTTTIAVGDPLTFRLEAQDGYNYATDIFATNVIARDPYSGRSVQLIDRYGCVRIIKLRKRMNQICNFNNYHNQCRVCCGLRENNDFIRTNRKVV